MKEYVERTLDVKGINRTTRDSRVPFNYPRAMQNWSLPDGRLKHRPGFKPIEAPVSTQALAKATGVSIARRMPEAQHIRNYQYTTPLSYGLIRWHDDYQLRRSADKTIELMVRLGDKEELVIKPFNRQATHISGAQWAGYLLRLGGVYILDQTITSNIHKFNSGFVNKDASVTAGTLYDLSVTDALEEVFPLTTFALKYTHDQIRLSIMLFNTAGAFYINCENLVFAFPGGSYTPGDTYHVGIVHDASDNKLELWVDGVLADTFNLPAGYVFVGQEDNINGIAYATGQKRDIVLLNESVCRGNYSSACRLSAGTTAITQKDAPQAYHHSYTGTGTVPNPVPWCQSPPRGTAIWDLRIWNEDKGSGITSVKNKRILPTDSGITNLKGNWWLNEGGAVCANHVDGLERRFATVHYGYPSFVDEPTMLSKRGIKLGEGQHLILRTEEQDAFLGRGLQSKLADVFAPDASAALADVHQDRHSFTVQMQVLVPDAFQPELNDSAGAGLTMRDLALVETRRALTNGVPPANGVYDLRDGQQDLGVTTRSFFSHPTEAIANNRPKQTARAFDQTLWSIEGTQLPNGKSDEYSKRRIPLARGMINPAGQVVFELSKIGNSGATDPELLKPQYLRLVTSASLVVGKLYSLTFVQRASYVYDAASNSVVTRGWIMEIHVRNITDDTAFVATTFGFTYDGATNNNVMTSACFHKGDLDIIVGASYVNDHWDWSTKTTTAVPASLSSSYDPTAGADRGIWGPYPVNQHFQTPFQDQHANVIVGMFRMWTTPLEVLTLQDLSEKVISFDDYTPDLIINLEFGSVTGTKILSQCRYPEIFDMGFKGWGQPRGHKPNPLVPTTFSYYGTFSGTIAIPLEYYEGPWVHQDCLGYTLIKGTVYDNRSVHCPVNGLSSYKSYLSETFGALAVFGDAVSIDEAVIGSYEPTPVVGSGLMSEFFPGSIWRGTLVGNLTILTSLGGRPKVFDGRNLQVAGINDWAGGKAIAYENIGGGALLTTGWYGVVVVYVSETANIYEVSPVARVFLPGNGSIVLINVPLHPDPRVSRIEVYRTLPQVSESLAASAPLIKSATPGRYSDAFLGDIIINETDASLVGRPVLDRNVTPIPQGAYAASTNGKLYIGGDPLNPDNVYISDSGNAQIFDSVFNVVFLNDNSGNVQTGIVEAFGTILCFKPNGIWRVDDVGNGAYQSIKVSSIGAVSDQSILSIQDPDTGRPLVFFWSQHGPYIFDGSVAQYIGTPIEEKGKDAVALEAGIITSEYSWLDPKTVVAVHNDKAREIMCLYKPRVIFDEQDVIMPLRSEAIVFNYRNQAWFTYTGMIGDVGISLSFTGDSRLVVPPTVPGKPTELRRNFTYQLLIGAYNGRIYRWDDSLTDGITDAVLNGPFLVSPVSGNVFNLSLAVLPDITDPHNSIIGAWVTFTSAATGDTVSGPIIANTSNEVTIDTRYTEKWSFVPILLDFAIIGVMPAYVEFPWDEMGIPFVDKELVELLTWHNGQFRYKTAINYDLATFQDTWLTLTSGTSKRKRTQIKRRSDAVKLKMYTLDLLAAVDAIAYEVFYGANTGNTPQ